MSGYSKEEKRKYYKKGGLTETSKREKVDCWRRFEQMQCILEKSETRWFGGN